MLMLIIILGHPHNGNYLGCLELLSEFDPFLKEHMKNYGNKGSGSLSYLSANICDEFIEEIGRMARKLLLEDIQENKYYSIVLDSTPDISHIDQLTFIIRFVKTINDKFLFFCSYLLFVLDM